MKRLPKKSLVLTLVVAAFGLTQALPAPPRVSITDLGTLPGTTGSAALGINDRGQVVGFSCGDYTCHAVLWQDGTITDLGTLGGTRSLAYGINDRGQIVGFATTAFHEVRAFLWQDGSMIDLGTLPDGIQSFAFGINDRGQVVGTNYGPVSCGAGCVTDGNHAFLWQHGTMTDLGDLGVIEAFGINARGQVVGYYDHAVLWQDGTTTDLGTLPGDPYSVGVAINEHGQVVGSSGSTTAPSGYAAQHAFLWQDGSMIDLGTLPGDAYSEAFAINNRGQVVGESYGDGSHHASLWQDGTMIGLPTLLGDTVSSARGINDHGEIVGYSGGHAVLWEVGEDR